MYVRVFGHLRSFMQKRSVVAFRVQPLENFDELTYHFLEVIYVHIHATRVPMSTTTTTTSMGNYMPASNQMISMGNDLNFNVLAAIRAAGQMETGASVQDIAQRLGRNEHDIRSALDHLTGEGFVYSTVDEGKRFFIIIAQQHRSLPNYGLHKGKLTVLWMTTTQLDCCK